MAKIYTKTGDKGTTGLVSGNRVSKGDARIDLYGDVDELNSFLGFTICSLQDASLIEFLRKIQSVLFDLGSNLACEEANRLKFKLPQVSEKIIADLEFAIDGMDSKMMTLKNFILPGGIEAAGRVHLCRTISRRVERKLISYHESSGEELPENSVKFLNRLSDYFFVLARFVNYEAGVDDIAWVKGDE